MLIKLNSIDAVKNFVNILNHFNADIDLISGRVTVDAKSILGILCLDLTRPIYMEIHNKDEEENIALAIKDYIFTYGR